MWINGHLCSCMDVLYVGDGHAPSSTRDLLPPIPGQLSPLSIISSSSSFGQLSPLSRHNLYSFTAVFCPGGKLINVSQLQTGILAVLLLLQQLTTCLKWLRLEPCRTKISIILVDFMTHSQSVHGLTNAHYCKDT